jgi:hypothetical protein
MLAAVLGDVGREDEIVTYPFFLDAGGLSFAGCEKHAEPDYVAIGAELRGLLPRFFKLVWSEDYVPRSIASRSFERC